MGFWSYAAAIVLLSGGGALAQSSSDGAWTGRQTCPATGQAKGFTHTFGMTVTGNRVLGQLGTKGTPDSFTMIGQIAPDGSATLQVNGLTGDAAYNVGGVATGQPYSYTVSATFQQNSGTGTRIHVRPCTFTFAKLGASQPGQKSAAPVISAYEGNVGDWALGRWAGMIYPDYDRGRMTTEARIMIIERQPDGKVTCLWAYPPQLAQVAWAPKCKIDANSISLVTTADSTVELDRSDSELRGRMRSSNSTRFRAQLTRAK